MLGTKPALPGNRNNSHRPAQKPDKFHEPIVRWFHVFIIAENKNRSIPRSSSACNKKLKRGQNQEAQLIPNSDDELYKSSWAWRSRIRLSNSKNIYISLMDKRTVHFRDGCKTFAQRERIVSERMFGSVEYVLD